MSLLDDDSAAIERAESNSNRKRKPLALGGRFNKMNSYLNKQRAKAKVAAKEEPVIAKPDEPIIEAAPTISEAPKPTVKTETVKPIEKVKPVAKKVVPNETGSLTGSISGSTGSTIGSETGSKTVQPEPVKEMNQLQTGSETGSTIGSKTGSEKQPETSIFQPRPTVVGPDITDLSSGPRKMMELFYFTAKRTGSRVVGPFTKKELGARLNMPYETVKTTMRRLRTREFIVRTEMRRGKSGAQKIEIAESVFKQFQISENLEKEYSDWSVAGAQTGSISGSQTGSITGETVPSSSSSNLKLKKETTSTSLEGPWAEIRIPSVLENRLSKGVIFQVRDRALCVASELQQSLDFFAYDVEENKLLESKKIASPQAWFMKIMTSNRSYPKPEGFETDEEKAEKELLERLERQTAEREERKKKIFELSYKAWAEDLSMEEKRKLKPEFIDASDMDGPMFENVLRGHFKEHLFGK